MVEIKKETRYLYVAALAPSKSIISSLHIILCLVPVQKPKHFLNSNFLNFLEEESQVQKEELFSSIKEEYQVILEENLSLNFF
jgi:hypothetical protein